MLIASSEAVGVIAGDKLKAAPADCKPDTVRTSPIKITKDDQKVKVVSGDKSQASERQGFQMRGSDLGTIYGAKKTVIWDKS
jgi:hypothetical protein